jgi:DNA-binding GntR family transcriptional regulator
VRGLGEPPYALGRLAAAVTEGQLASVEDDWKGVGTANIHFHRELVALAGIARTDELMRSVFAELRLAFHLVDDPKALHEPYLQRNRLILQALQASDPAEAEKLLAVYLDDSLERVVDAYRQRVGEDGAALD